MQLAALTVAILVAFQLSLSHWFYLYLPWFAPFVALWLLLPEPAYQSNESKIGYPTPRVDAVGREERRPDVAREERVAASAALVTCPLDLLEGMDGEAARTLEPELVPGSRERLQERVAVAGRAVADARALLHPVAARRATRAPLLRARAPRRGTPRLR